MNTVRSSAIHKTFMKLYRRSPSFYTENECGSFEGFPSNVVILSEDLDQRSDSYVMMGDLKVHALAFGHPSAGLGNFARWDCVNGWTDLPDDIVW